MALAVQQHRQAAETGEARQGAEVPVRQTRGAGVPARYCSPSADTKRALRWRVGEKGEDGNPEKKSKKSIEFGFLAFMSLPNLGN